MSARTHGGVAVAVLLAVGAGFGFMRYRASPSYALGQIRAAVEDRDRLRFEEYVDLDGLTNSAVDAVMAQTMGTMASESTDGWGALGMALGSAMMAQVKPALATSAKTAVLRSVESGSMDSVWSIAASAEKGPSPTVVSNALGAAPGAFSAAELLDRRGNRAILGIRIRAEFADTLLLLRLGMTRGDGPWRVTEFVDLPGYLSEVERLQGVRLRAVNDSIAALMSRHVRLGALQATKRNMGWFQERLEIHVPVENVGPDTIHFVTVTLHDASGKKLDEEAWVGRIEPIPPGVTGDAFMLKDLNQFIEWHNTVLYGSARPRLRWLVVGGDTLKAFDSWAEWLVRG